MVPFPMNLSDYLSRFQCHSQYSSMSTNSKIVQDIVILTRTAFVFLLLSCTIWDVKRRITVSLKSVLEVNEIAPFDRSHTNSNLSSSFHSNYSRVSYSKIKPKIENRVFIPFVHNNSLGTQLQIFSQFFSQPSQ